MALALLLCRLRHAQNKALVDRLEGADAVELGARVEALQKPGSAAPAGAQAVKALDALAERVKRLIGASPVMLFMKGTPEEPKCKFSRRAVELLQAERASFGSYGASVRRGSAGECSCLAASMHTRAGPGLSPSQSLALRPLAPCSLALCTLARCFLLCASLCGRWTTTPEHHYRALPPLSSSGAPSLESLLHRCCEA